MKVCGVGVLVWGSVIHMDALVLPVLPVAVVTCDGPGALIVPVEITGDGAVVERSTGAPVDLASLVVLIEDDGDVPALASVA